MAAAAVAANSQQQQQQCLTKSGKAKQLNEIYKTNEYYEYLNKNELANSNSNKHVDDESDSNYLNKLKRHKFSEAKHMDMLNTSNDEINENDLLVAAKFNPNQQQQQSGAKKRKRQFTSNQQQQQPVYESDEADGEQVDNQEEMTTLAQRKHLKLMNEQTTPVKSVSRRKSKTHNFYSNHDHSNGDLDDETGRDINEENEEEDEEDDEDDMDDEEDRYVKARVYNNEEGDNDEDMEVGQITINASLINQSKEEDEDEDELNDDSDNELVQSSGALEVGELIRKSQSEYEEDLNEKENGNEEDEEEENQYDDEPILLNDQNQINNMHSNGLLAQLHHGEASKSSYRHGDFHKQQQQLSSNKQINNGMQNKQQQQSNRFVAQNDYSQNALIASTLANLAAAANLNNNGQLQGSNGNLNASSNSSSASKIFHVDAYCYLCKKEFCNKYFLRTHLANKHKVFLNSNDLSTLSGASMSKLQNDLLEEQQKNKFNRKNKSQQQRVGAPNGASNVRSSSASSSGSAHSSASSSTSNSPVPQQQQHAQSNLTIANVLYTQQNGGKSGGNKLANQASSASSMSSEELISNAYMKLNGDSANPGNSSATSSAVEDFCELCNKQFCNKYYLKKHKFDVHGILVENNIKSYKKIDEPSMLQQQSNFMNSQSGRSTVNGLINGANNSPLKPSSNSFNNNSFNNNNNNLQASLFSNSSQSHSLALAAAAAAAGNLSNMMFVNPYMSPIMQLPHVMPVNSTVPASSANSSSLQQNQQAANVNSNQNVSSSPSSSSSSSSCSSSSASPPNMAMDMLNRLSSGQAPSNIDMAKTKLNKSESTVSLKNMDGVEAEAGATKVQRLPGKEVDKKAPSSSSSTSSNSTAPNGAVSVACDLCKKEFFNEEYLKLHKINKHKLPADSFTSSSQTPQAVAALPKQAATSSTSSNSSSTSTSSSFPHSKPSISPTSASAAVGSPPSPRAAPIANNESFNASELPIKSIHESSNTLSSINTNKLVANPNSLLKQMPAQFDLFGGNNAQAAAAAAAAAAAGISTPAIFGIMDSYFAAKMADRVTCDICNKQVCNKYFLKTHKLKVHGCADNNSASVNMSGMNGQMPDNEGDYEMSEDMMSEMANEITGRINGQHSKLHSSSQHPSQGNDEEDNGEYENESASFKHDNNQDSNDADERHKPNIGKQLQNSLNQLRSTGSPNSALAQMFNKSTLAAMGFDQQNNAAALAATLATLSNYSQSLNMNTSMGQSAKPRPPALARVSCQICRKELCNKYFLKSHLLNAHHITADDLYMNNLLESSPQQQQNGERLLKSELFELNKKFNVFNKGGEQQPQQQQQQRSMQSPTASMRSSSSSYTGNNNTANLNVQKLKRTKEEELEEGQQIDEEQQQMNRDSDDEEPNETAMNAAKQNLISLNALLNYNKMINNSGDNSSQNAAAALMQAVNGSEDSPADSSAFGSSCSMQPFLFECKEESFISNFVPCMVYLPVKSKLGAAVTIKVTLKPLDTSANGNSDEVEENEDEF